MIQTIKILSDNFTGLWFLAINAYVGFILCIGQLHILILVMSYCFIFARVEVNVITSRNQSEILIRELFSFVIVYFSSVMYLYLLLFL